MPAGRYPDMRAHPRTTFLAMVSSTFHRGGVSRCRYKVQLLQKRTNHRRLQYEQGPGDAGQGGFVAGVPGILESCDLWQHLGSPRRTLSWTLVSWIWVPLSQIESPQSTQPVCQCVGLVLTVTSVISERSRLSFVIQQDESLRDGSPTHSPALISRRRSSAESLPLTKPWA